MARLFTGTICLGSNAYDVLKGWKQLVEGSVPIDLYMKAFYVSTLNSVLKHESSYDTQVDDETLVNNRIEPVVLELLRLSYWIYKCKERLNPESFDVKFAEVKSSLISHNLNEVRGDLDRNLRNFGKLMADRLIPKWERALYERELMELVEVGGQFRSNISSYVPEFMSAALMKEAGFEIEFIPTGNEKRCDFLLNSFKVEVKTFLDMSYEPPELEKSLNAEILGTLKRNKAVGDMKDALSKKADIVLMFLSFTTLGVGFSKYTFKKDIDFSLGSALSKSISIAQRNQTTQDMTEVPVITFTTLIDFSDCIYKMFFYTVPYPVKKDNGKFEPDPDKLTIDLDI